MQEVTRQLGPLTERVGTLSNNLERLYNSNGGPPGYLQTARAEDTRRFEEIFKILKEHKDAIEPIKNLVNLNSGLERQRKEDDKRLERKFNTRLSILGVLLAFLMLITSNLQGCRKAAAALTTSEVTNATIPNTR